MRATPNKWILCVLLFVATTLNYLDRQALGILAPSMQNDLGFNNVALGWLFSVFYYSYTFAQFGIGAVLDRAHLRWAYGIGVLAWSATAALTALATGFAGLLVFRLLLGVTESVNWPAAMRIVARALPPNERSLGNAIFTSGTSLGALIAPALILGTSALVGWRAAFVAVGSLGAFWFVAWLLFTRDRRLNDIWKRTDEDAANRKTTGAVYAEIIASRAFWRVFAVTILVNPCLYFNVNWLPIYFVQQRGMSAHELSGVLTVIYLGLDLGYLFCGGSILWLTRRSWSLATARRGVFLLATLSLGCCGLVPFAPDVRSAVTLLAITNFGVGAWIAMYLTMAQEVSAANVSTAAGLLGGSGSLAGAFAMWAVGRVTHDTGSFVIPMLGVTCASIMAAVAGLAVVRKRSSGAPEFITEVRSAGH